MNQYIATFHTHLAALTTARALGAEGIPAKMMPVPRKLSSSCGTCVRYEAGEACLPAMDADVERVYEIGAEDRYTLLMENK